LLRSALAATELQVSPLGLGTVELGMPYGLGKPTPPDDKSCIRLLHHAVDRGINFVDTAAAYGRSEELIGRAFGNGDRPVIGTKVTLRDVDGTPHTGTRLSAAMRTSIDRSRQLLGMERLDLVQIHNADAIITKDPALADAMAYHLEADDVRFWGASTYGQQAASAVLEYGPPFRTLQVAYSVLDRNLEVELFPLCRNSGTGLILRSVLLQGVLSDRRHALADALAPLRQAADAAADVAEALGKPLPEVALRYALFEAGADITLVGTANLAELDSNVNAALDGPLPSDVVAALRAIRISDERLLDPSNWPLS
jgi:aryl-alcohol dehydrogenase-like predicted oxidoreductase